MRDLKEDLDNAAGTVFYSSDAATASSQSSKPARYDASNIN